jgi:hypothetical protein
MTSAITNAFHFEPVVVHVGRTIDSLDCDILSNFENPSKRLQTTRGNNNGALSTEEQAVNNDCPKTDVHSRFLESSYGLVPSRDDQISL